MGIVKEFLNKIKAKNIVLEKEKDDFFYELSNEDLKEIELAEQELEAGLFVTNEEVQKKSENTELKNGNNLGKKSLKQLYKKRLIFGTIKTEVQNIRIK